MSSSTKIKLALGIFVFIVIIGTSGYIVLENYSLLEGIYMTVITVTTVGFGEIRPLSPVGRAFTTGLILFGFGSLAFAGHAIAESLIEKIGSDRDEREKMRKQIALLKDHVIICGAGRVGSAAADRFKELGVPFVVIESHEKRCEELRKEDILVLEGDATDENLLLEGGIKKAKGFLALLDSDAENLFLALTARELNPVIHIIARADKASSQKKTYRAGADMVVSPFSTAGIQVADSMVAKGGHRPGTVSAPEKVSTQWFPVAPNSPLAGKTVGEINVETKRNVIGLRRGEEDHLMPDHTMTVEPGDLLLTVQEGEEKGAVPPVREHRSATKVVLVDDNPAIVKLYSRLFKRKGFHPIAATSGEEGLKVIVNEKPAVAVIDLVLPDLSGIELCRRLRETPETRDTKLLIFTAEDDPDTRKRAVEAGADAVVVKSSQAYEVIEAAAELLLDF